MLTCLAKGRAGRRAYRSLISLMRLPAFARQARVKPARISPVLKTTTTPERGCHSNGARINHCL